tara:strand:- start:193 stop:471 length:279 start_codon:yes stop_codon:yes gene_type:complete
MLIGILFNQEVQTPAYIYAVGWSVNPDDVASGYKKYPDPHVPVLADEYRFLHTRVKPAGLPCIFLIEEKMCFINDTSRGLTDALLYLTKQEK